MRPKLVFVSALIIASLGFHAPTKVIQHEPWYTKGEPSDRPFATRERTLITIHPSGASFRIPEAWVERHNRFGDNLHLSRPQLEAVARGSGEWDTEYASVSNAVLPFDRCCAHVGDDGWGVEASSFGDLQVRVYVVSEAPESIEKKIMSSGLSDIERFSGKRPSVQQHLGADWRQTVLSFDRFYGDYGGKANVDFRIRRFKPFSVIIVCMYSNYRGGIDAKKNIKTILESFRVH